MEVIGIVSLSLTALGIASSITLGGIMLARKIKQKYKLRAPLKRKEEEKGITIDDLIHVVENVKLGLDSTRETIEEIKSKTTGQTLLYPSAIPIVKNI